MIRVTNVSQCSVPFATGIPDRKPSSLLVTLLLQRETGHIIDVVMLNLHLASLIHSKLILHFET